MSLSRDNFLEKKLSILEQRLTLVERFIEARFYEGCTDPSGGKKGKDDSSKANDERAIGRRANWKKTKLEDKDVKDDEDDNAFEDRPSSSGNGYRNVTVPGVTRSSSRVQINKNKPQVSKRNGGSLANKPSPTLSAKRKAANVASKENTKGKQNPSNTPTTPTTRGKRKRENQVVEVVVVEDAIEDCTKKARYNTRTRRHDEETENKDKDNEDDQHTFPSPQSSVAAELINHDITQDNPSSPVGNENIEGEDDETGYFTFPGIRSPPRSVIAGSVIVSEPANLEGGDEDDEVNNEDEGDPLGEEEDALDGSWSDTEKDVERSIRSSSEGEDSGGVSKTKRKRKKAITRKTTRKSLTSRKSKSGTETPRKRNRPFISAIFADLPIHAIAGVDPTKRECPMCHKHFKLEVFESHMEVHTKERHLRCPECDKTYFNQSMLRKHMRVHQPDKYAQKCRLCEKVFFQSDKVLAHERFCVKKTLEKNQYVDPSIIQDLKRRSAADWLSDTLENSQSDVTATNTKKCPHCKKLFEADLYDNHVKSHDISRNWACNLCDKAYVHKHDLVRHIATEHVKNPVCEICQITCKDRPALKKHLVVCRRERRKRMKAGRGSEQNFGVKEELILESNDEVTDNANNADEEETVELDQSAINPGEAKELYVGEIVLGTPTLTLVVNNSPGKNIHDVSAIPVILEAHSVSELSEVVTQEVASQEAHQVEKDIVTQDMV